MPFPVARVLGPLLVLGEPEPAGARVGLESCVGCKALAMHGLQSSRGTRVGVFAVPGGVYAGRDPGQVGEGSV